MDNSGNQLVSFGKSRARVSLTDWLAWSLPAKSEMQGESMKMQGASNPTSDENLWFSDVYDVPSLLQ
jgi:hypothetical protein